MKYKSLYLLLLAGLLFSRCGNRYKIVYNIPDATPAAERKELMVTIDHGKKLYRAYCSECHGIFTKGKDNIPNFTNKQIDNYSARFLGRDPKVHGVALKMSQEQMNEILTFLKYKRHENTYSKART